MLKAKTESGFECEIDEGILNDVEILDVFCELEDGNPAHVGKAVKKMLRDDAKRLYDHVRTEDDRVPVEALGKELADIVNSINELKK